MPFWSACLVQVVDVDVPKRLNIQWASFLEVVRWAMDTLLGFCRLPNILCQSEIA